MTQASKLKKQIRTRATKTGESYSAARRQVLAARAKRTGKATATAQAARAASARPQAPPRTSLGSVSERKCLERTGHGLDYWFAVLDKFGAVEKGHTAAARHLFQDHGVPGWHSQGITVAYERGRGLRGINQACTGKFQVSVSRVLPATVQKVIDAFASAERRKQWLAGADPELTRALRAGLQSPKGRSLGVRPKGDARLRFRWGATAVEIRIDPRPGGKASIAADNTDLTDTSEVELRRESWKVALDGLRQHLST